MKRVEPKREPVQMREAGAYDYLGEAFRIAAGQSWRVPEREHLVAVIEHCRKLVSAVMNLSEVR